MCQYSFKPDGALCPSSAATQVPGTRKNKTRRAMAGARQGTNTAAALFSEEEDVLVGLSAKEIEELGLPAYPSAELMDAEDVEYELAQLMSTVETAQAKPRKQRKTAQAKRVTTCGRCRNRVCVSAKAKFCKVQRLTGHPSDSASI